MSAPTRQRHLRTQAAWRRSPSAFLVPLAVAATGRGGCPGRKPDGRSPPARGDGPFPDCPVTGGRGAGRSGSTGPRVPAGAADDRCPAGRAGWPGRPARHAAGPAVARTGRANGDPDHGPAGPCLRGPRGRAAVPGPGPGSRAVQRGRAAAGGARGAAAGAGQLPGAGAVPAGRDDHARGGGRGRGLSHGPVGAALRCGAAPSVPRRS